MTRTRLWAALPVGLALGALTGCAGTASVAADAGHTRPVTKESWIFTKQALDAVTTNATVRARLSHGRIYEILKNGETPHPNLPVIPTASFTSEAGLASVVNGGRLARDIQAVLYDSEHWSQTPAAEQRDPARYYRQAAAIAHAHHLTLVATPAMDLADVNGNAGDPAQAFLAGGIESAVGKVADVVDIQAQSLERDTNAYRDFVTRAARQVATANPRTTVLAGLTTNRQGWNVTPSMLVTDILATGQRVTGYWVNIPSKGTYCPSCGKPRPDIAIKALSDPRLAKPTS